MRRQGGTGVAWNCGHEQLGHIHLGQRARGGDDRGSDSCLLLVGRTSHYSNARGVTRMIESSGSVVSVHIGDHVDLHKDEQPEVQAKLDGFVGDKHRGYARVAFEGDIDPAGTVRRNERQWSGVSIEELEVITQRMDLREPLAASTLGANLCFKGIGGFSQLPRGTRLYFPSGAVLRVEECNPPCVEMGDQIAAAYTTNAGGTVVASLFPKHALNLRGVVGVVDVPGTISLGDRVVARSTP